MGNVESNAAGRSPGGGTHHHKTENQTSNTHHVNQTYHINANLSGDMRETESRLMQQMDQKIKTATDGFNKARQEDKDLIRKQELEIMRLKKEAQEREKQASGQQSPAKPNYAKKEEENEDQENGIKLDPLAALALLAVLGAGGQNSKGYDPRKPIVPPQNKEMKEILPYSSDFEEFIDNYIKYDITDDIPDVHHPLADFYAGVGFDAIGKGEYTGWVINDQPNGRGSWVSNGGSMRIDGLWKNGKLHGLGRIIYLNKNPHEAWQGVFEANNATDGADKFTSIGVRFKWIGPLRQWAVML